MAGQRPAALLYDAECGFCRATAGLVLAWDRRRRLSPVALQDPSAPQRLSGLSEQQRMASWHLVEPDGTRHSGGAALAPLFETLPRGAPLARLVRRSPAGAERVYVLAADHRDLLAKLVPPRLRRRAEQTLERRTAGAAEAGEPASGFPEPPRRDPGDRSRDRDPHHVLNNPVVDDPDLTEWPDPYETREDPRAPAEGNGMSFGEQPHPPVGSTSTSEPHPSEDPEAERWEGPKRDKLDQ
jgi:predicted DCC family thiol-disulfide oxidoreductase YuxK